MKISIAKYVCLIIVLLVVSVSAQMATDAAQQNLKNLQKQLEKEFIAPCCWNESVATHQGSGGVEVRGAISTLLTQGKSPEQIRQYMVDKYSTRILIEPEAKGFDILAWIGPFIMLFVGLIFVVIYLRKIGPDGEGELEAQVD